MSTWSLTGVLSGHRLRHDISHWDPGETSGAHTTVGFTSRCSCECLARLQELASAGQSSLSSTQGPA